MPGFTDGSGQIKKQEGTACCILVSPAAWGAGKSEILKYLEQEYNCRVLLADEVAHDLMEPGTDCYSRLRQLFAGDGVFAEDGRIDRPALARVLFSDEEKRKACDGIVHPAVWDAVAKAGGGRAAAGGAGSFCERGRPPAG